MARRPISNNRKTLYYVGMGLCGIGAISFLSVFVTHIANFGNFDNFEGQVRSAGFRAIGGMAMIFVGRLLMVIGWAGLGGSGVLLDPERTREDVEPWSRMGGGILKDALDEAGLDPVARGARTDAQGLPFDEKLRRLHALWQEGILSEKEYQREKRELLDQDQPR